jgi:aryl-alcohol dehydrogenase-like predicted oxidoreductase
MPLDHYVSLGRSGLRVSPFALGAMTFGEDPGAAGSSVEESEKILGTYLDLGGNFVDTANFYTKRPLGKDPRRLVRSPSGPTRARGRGVEVLLQHVSRRP